MWHNPRAGNGLIIANGPAEKVFTLDQLRAQWATLHMRVFISVCVVLLVALHAGVLYVKVRAQFRPMLHLI